jgi:hypothetical protein
LFFYGLRFDVAERELELLENRTHPAIQAVRNVGLQHYWGNFAEPGEKYLLFVGANLGIVGLENSQERRIEDAELNRCIQETQQKLKQTGLSGTPALHVQWMPDS